MSYNKLDPLNECCCQSEIPSVYESDLSIPEQVQRNSNDIDVLKKNNANITVDLVNTKKTVEANRKGIENLTGQADKSINTRLNAVTEQTTANLEAISLLEQNILEMPGLPSPTAEDYGKVLMVNNLGEFELVRLEGVAINEK